MEQSLPVIPAVAVAGPRYGELAGPVEPAMQRAVMLQQALMEQGAVALARTPIMPAVTDRMAM